MKDWELYSDKWRIFERFVCIRNSFPSNCVSTYVLKFCASNDAFKLIKEAIIEYVHLQEGMSEVELMHFGANHLKE